MKVVINRCFGGFSLSPLAVKRLAELNGRECYFYSYAAGDDGLPNVSRYERVERPDNKLHVDCFSTPDVEEVNRVCDSSRWHKMSHGEKDAHNALYAAISLDSRPEDRTDPKLIQTVEELGDKANGQCAELKIVEIPDGVEWEISEYDGLEHIAEKHKTWA